MTSITDKLLGVSPPSTPPAAPSGPSGGVTDRLLAPPARAVPAEAAPQSAPQSYAAGMLDRVTNGLMLGYGSRLTALEKAILGGTEEESFWQEYDRFLAAETAQNERFREENPVSAVAGEVAGAVAPALVTGGGSLLARVGANVAGLTPAGIAARLGMGGTTRAGQVGRAVGSGAAAGAVYGSAEGEGAVDRAMNAGTGAASGAAGGAAGYALGELGRRALTYVVGRPGLFKGGKMTDEGKAALASVGLNPDEISDDFAKAFAARIQQAGGASDETARMAVADEFGIPLTRGQATGDVTQSAFEEAARNEARGALAGTTVRRIDDAARARVGASVNELAPAAQSATAAGEGVRLNVRSAAEASKSAYKAAYQLAAATDATIDVRAFQAIPEIVGARLDEMTLAPSAQAQGALSQIRRFTERVDREAGAVGASFQAVEGLRKKLNKVYGNLPAGSMERSEVGAVISGLDDWIDGVMDAALISGSDDALAKIKDARAMFGLHRRTFGAQPKDDASRIIERLVERDELKAVQPQEVANWLYGASKVGASGTSVRLTRRLKGILSAEQMDEVKAGAIRRLFNDAGEGPRMGYQRMATNLNEFLTGNGASLAKELFSPGELLRLRRFEKALRILIPPAEATNPSKTGYAVARLGQDMARAAMTSLGLATGGPVGAIGAAIASAVPGAVKNTAQAVSIPAAAPRLVTRPAAAAVVGGATAGASIGTQEVPR